MYQNLHPQSELDDQFLNLWERQREKTYRLSGIEKSFLILSTFFSNPSRIQLRIVSLTLSPT